MEVYNSTQYSFDSQELRALAQDLFHDSQYLVFKNFLSPVEVKEIRDYFQGGSGLSTVGQVNTYHHFLARYYFKNEKKSQDAISSRLFDICHRASLVRNRICLQPNSDQHMLAYCQRYKINPENEEALVGSQMNHSFIRVANYRSGQGQIPHRDYPGEIQCIIPLTQLGVDYERGGLVVMDASLSAEVHIDPLVQSGDLIILNAYSKTHRVEPVECRPDQAGRMHLFLPIIPDHQFSRQTYYFSENPFRPLFRSGMSRAEKYFYCLYHFYLLFFRRNDYRPADLR